MEQPVAKNVTKCWLGDAKKIEDFANKQTRCYITYHVFYGLLIYTYEETHKIIEDFIRNLNENIHYDVTKLEGQHYETLNKKLKQNENII